MSGLLGNLLYCFNDVITGPNGHLESPLVDQKEAEHIHSQVAILESNRKLLIEFTDIPLYRCQSTPTSR